MIFRKGLLAVVMLVGCAVSVADVRSHRDLNWNAPRRWVHVDNVNPQLVSVFEHARQGWLTALKTDSGLLGDGRPLFWCARAGKVQTYFTFYPWGPWGDMDARRTMAMRTDSLVGEAAVNRYDSGDSALVAPHYSELWQRRPESDIAWAGTDSLTELTAPVGRLEFHQMDEARWEEYTQVWDSLKATLIREKYPLACRVYSNLFGHSGGQMILFWLAPSKTSYQAAPPLNTTTEVALGKAKSDAMFARLDALFPAKESYEVERRLDLSNLGR
jgi:hypothetical protein